MRRGSWIAYGLLSIACGDTGGRDDSTDTTVTTLPPTQTMTPTTGADTTGLAGTTGTTGEPGEPGDTTTGTSTGDTTAPLKLDMPATPDLPPEPPLPNPQLWYSVADKLVYIEVSPLDGNVVQLVTSTITNNPSLAGPLNSCGLTMLPDGSLLGSRGNEVGTRMFHIPDPPKVATDLEVDILGMLPGEIYVEALHTGCDGRVYLMDTGADSVSNAGNRLLRFNADYLAGAFAYDVITDLMTAVSADIDDMAPGITENGNIRDNPGFGIDSGQIYALDYSDGTGNLLGMAGTYGVHALGGPLFDDGDSRLYVLDVDANLYEADPISLALSPVLATGPALMSGDPPGDTGLAGPLTDCVTGFPPG